MNHKIARLRRIMDRERNRTVIIPLDHGVTYGQMRGIEDLRNFVASISDTSVDALILHKGMLQQVVDIVPKEIGLIMHLSGSVCFSPKNNKKYIVGSVEEAIRFGADAVSIHINIGCQGDDEMLYDLGRISEQCNQWNMPLIVMIYPTIVKDGRNSEKLLEVTMHCIRICEELGADLVKVGYVDGLENMEFFIKSAHIPILVAGGEKCEREILLQRIHSVINAGAAGVTIGRNVFQSENPEKLLEEIYKIIHK